MVVKMDKHCIEFQHIYPSQSYKPWDKNEPTSHDMLMPAYVRQIAAVFVSRDLQVLCDVLRSGGFPGKSDSELHQSALFFAADDFEYRTKFPVPRFGKGAFRVVLESLYTNLEKRPLAYTCYGKPKPDVYKQASKSLNKLAKRMYFNESSALKTLFMVGDNPETGIAGVVGAGRPWFSILVRSGNFQGTDNHDNFSADEVVDDVYEAVELLLQREGVDTK